MNRRFYGGKSLSLNMAKINGGGYQNQSRGIICQVYGVVLLVLMISPRSSGESSVREWF